MLDVCKLESDKSKNSVYISINFDKFLSSNVIETYIVEEAYHVCTFRTTESLVLVDRPNFFVKVSLNCNAFCSQLFPRTQLRFCICFDEYNYFSNDWTFVTSKVSKKYLPRVITDRLTKQEGSLNS